jgi:tetratricopeptide (TPR) repeat protein
MTLTADSECENDTGDYDYAIPTEQELVLLCLDYFNDLRLHRDAENNNELLEKNKSSLDGNNNKNKYLTIACWALHRVLAAASVNDGARLDAESARTTNNKQHDATLTIPSFSQLQNELEQLLSDNTNQNNAENDEPFEYYSNNDSDPNNAHRLYLSAGLGNNRLTLCEITASGLCGLGARSRREAEHQMTQSKLFRQFVQAVTERGFFNDTTSTDDKQRTQLYNERYAKVVAKFRNKLAHRADPDVLCDSLALNAAEMQRQRALHHQQQEILDCGALSETKSYSSNVSSSRRQQHHQHDLETMSTTDNCNTNYSINPVDTQQAEKLKNAGNAHMQNKEFARAAECYTMALKVQPAGPHSHVYYSNRAAALVSMQRFEEAIVDSERSLVLRPDYGKAHARLGLAHYLLGNYRQAMEAYAVALKYEPNNKSSKNYLEKAAKRLAESDQELDDRTQTSFSVVSEWEKSTVAKHCNDDQQQQQPVGRNREAEKYKVRGNTFMSNRDYEKARMAYTKAIELSGNGSSHSHVYYSNRAAALCYLELYKEAELDSLEALKLNPTYGKAYARLGLSRFFMCDYKGAVKAYQEAVKNDPTNAASKSYLAKALAKLNQHEEPSFCLPLDGDNAARVAHKLMDQPGVRGLAAKAMAAASNSSQRNNKDLLDDPEMIQLAKLALHDPAVMAVMNGYK